MKIKNIIIIMIVATNFVYSGDKKSSDKAKNLLVEIIDISPALTEKINEEQRSTGCRKAALYNLYEKYMLAESNYGEDAFQVANLLYIETLNPRFLYDASAYWEVPTAILALFNDEEIVQELDLINVIIECIKRSMSRNGYSFHWNLLGPLFEYRLTSDPAANFLSHYKEYLDLSLSMRYGDSTPKEGSLMVQELKRKYDVYDELYDKIERGENISDKDRNEVLRKLIIKD